MENNTSCTIIKKNEICSLPSSAATNIVMEVFTSASDLKNWKDRKNLIDHSASVYTVNKPVDQESEDKNQRQILVSTKTEDIAVEIPDINKLMGSNKGAKKLFILTLIAINKQALHNGELTKGYVTFPLQDLVDIGLYKSIQSARDGFMNARRTLASIQISSYRKNRKDSKKEGVTAELSVMFPNIKINNSQCVISLNTEMNWNFLTHYFTVIPDYYFQLPNTAGDLLYYIFYLARQNLNAIAKNGYFKIGFKAIQCKLNLPDADKTKNPGRDIKSVIIETAKQLEDAHASAYGNRDLVLTPVYNNKATIQGFLESGYLMVEIKGDLAENFLNLNRRTEKKIEDAERRRQHIVDEAIIRNMSKTAKLVGADKDKKTEWVSI